jgi:hypothetical protein
MTRLFVDATLPAKLRLVGEPVELCDESGRILGRFFPSIDPRRHGPLEPQVSEEELLRREQANEKRYSTAEVLAHLRKR